MSDNTPSIINIDQKASTLYPDLAEQDFKRVGPKPQSPKEKAEADQMAKLFPKMAAGLTRQKEARDDFERGQRKAVDEAFAKENAERDSRQEKDEPKDEKGVEAEGLSEGAAELYSEVKLPEGMELDPEEAEAFAEVADGLGLDKSAVAQLVKWDIERQQAMAEQIEQAKGDTIGEWNAQIEQDFSKDELQLAVQTFEEIGTPELGQLLAESGLGSHPAVVGLMVEVGKALNSGETGRITRALGRDARNRR